MLPIEPALPDIVAAIDRGNLVLVAPPGAGKTTLLPGAWLAEHADDPGDLWISQPRRLAARLAAHRVSELLGERVGGRCGYQVRFDSALSKRTRIRFVTEGLLARRLRDDPELEGVSTVVLDEFHERHVDGDLVLALLLRLQRRRPELRIVVMSATLQPDALASYLGAAIRTVEGRSFPVEIEYAYDKDRALPEQLRDAFRTLVDAGEPGHVLAFLPGAREIRAAREACEAAAERRGFSIHVLHGQLPREVQDAAVRPSEHPKLILATNVAETSVTIDGVAGVIDSGFARVPMHDPWSGIPRLEVAKISRASADQRAGRAGRTQPGRCVRLYAQHDYARRPAFTSPEISRADLSATLLDLFLHGIEDAEDFAWFEPPPKPAVLAALELLTDLGALERGRLSTIGKQLSRFPLHPRHARLLLAAQAEGVSDLGVNAAALLSEPPVGRDRGPASQDGDADVLVEVGWLEARRNGRNRRLPEAVDERRLDGVERVRRQLSDLVARDAPAPSSRNAREEALRRCILQAYPDRVARVRDEGGDRRTLVLCKGGSARLSPSSVVRTAPWVVGLSLETRSQPGRKSESFVRSACAIEPEWLLDLFAQRVEDEVKLRWDQERERVTGWSELRYGQLAIEGSELKRLPEGADAILTAAALAAGPGRFVEDPGALDQLLLRTRFLAQHVENFPALSAEDARVALEEMCAGKTSFRELGKRELVGRLKARLGAHGHRLDELAPREFRLASGRRLRITYESDRDPWVASRLQDFFGMKTGPVISDGRVPLVLHLLAPNGRDVQVTTDLHGFWEKHYPELRRTLMRRYPKHAWPEDPLSAKPPTPRSRKRR
jgi:ATP-dependent helicase HrpB